MFVTEGENPRITKTKHISFGVYFCRLAVNKNHDKAEIEKH